MGANDPMGILISPAMETPTVPSKTGKVYYVDATNGGDGNDGSAPDQALATIQAAIDKCVSGAGDIVYIYPGSYDENLTITSKDYVHLIGVQLPGYARPDVVPTTGVALDIDTSQGTVLKHIRFYSADSDVVQNEGNGFHFEDCVFDGDTGMAATEALLRLRGNNSDDSYTASEGKVIHSLFRGSNGYGIALDTGNAPSNGVGVTDSEFIECRFYGNAAEDVIALDTGAGAVYSVKNCLFDRCFFMDVDKTTYIDIQTNNAAGNALNMFSSCYFNTDDITGTNFKAAGTKAAIVGCLDKVGIEDASTLD